MMAEQNMQEFIEVLSSKAAVPGGGGACAYVAAAGMALGAMVANLTTGKKCAVSGRNRRTLIKDGTAF